MSLDDQREELREALLSVAEYARATGETPHITARLRDFAARVIHPSSADTDRDLVAAAETVLAAGQSQGAP